MKKPLQECTVDELQQAAEQYPYFGPLQLLLAKKISESSPYADDNSAQYEEQVQKASLYFQNRVWLHHLLNNDHNDAASGVHLAVPEAETPPQNEEVAKPVDFDYLQKTEGGTINEPPKEKLFEPEPTTVGIVSVDTESNEQALVNNKREEQEDPVSDEPNKTHQTNSPSEMISVIHEPTAGNIPMVFEPYHTVDYFASQGIRFKEEEKPKDRLGMQLKSFTEWLKTLKQVSVAELVSSIDSTAEKKVEQMAEFSVAERHVITEAMAEVWKKQGNRAKAEEIYRKLSLLDPPKSSYFAAKIEELKKIN
ncbi:MAG: hypothetical protein ACHQFX_00670 [Chitinophagales bacterium]